MSFLNLLDRKLIIQMVDYFFVKLDKYFHLKKENGLKMKFYLLKSDNENGYYLNVCVYEYGLMNHAHNEYDHYPL